MSTFNALDGHGKPVPTSLMQMTPEVKSVTFDGATADDPGDFDGTGNPHTLFLVTGVVRVAILAVVTTTLTGSSATIKMGSEVDPDGFMGATTATGMAVGEVWNDTTPVITLQNPEVVLAEKIVANSNLVQEVETANITGGAIDYYCFWQPLSPGATVVAAI